ncbi:MAG: hypothetical protein L3J79_05960, partial [Candidatus Marinimicrobia bacterium]|nr:hypothetical protein [Candidatus Neomarinimicrobiota bacterium]
MKKVQFIFGIHNHQPVGNFDHVFQHACDRSYLPFLQTLERFPNISMAFHFSGSLIEWLEIHRQDVLDLLKKLVQRGNIEILGAGFYEPILAMIPEADQIGQIRKMNQWAKQTLDYEIKGNWLTERVWEPHLAQSLNKADIDYMVVDDTHFLTSGIDPQNLSGYYYTEQEGRLVSVFPISQKLRYAMPFEDPQVTMDILKNYVTTDGANVVVMADDGALGMYKQNLERAGRVVGLGADDDEVLRWAALFNSGPDALQLLRKAAERFPGDEAVQWTLADVLIEFASNKCGGFQSVQTRESPELYSYVWEDIPSLSEEAATELSDLLQQNPGWKRVPHFWHQWAKVQLMVGQPDAAKTSLRNRSEADAASGIALLVPPGGDMKTPTYFEAIAEYGLGTDLLAPPDIDDLISLLLQLG